MQEILTVTLNPAVDVFTSVESIAPGHKLRCLPERRDAGGGGINVARAVKSLGGEVLAAYPAGGPIGEFLQRLVEAEGVKSLVIPIAGDTRESFTVWEQENSKRVPLCVAGPNSQRRGVSILPQRDRGPREERTHCRGERKLAAGARS